MSEPIDLGSEHTLRFTSWAPDRELNPHYDHVPDVERFGAIISHPNGPNSTTSTGLCRGAITFDGDVQRAVSPNTPKWTVERWDPLTLSPSILCGCGDHGFIRDGRWVTA